MVASDVLKATGQKQDKNDDDQDADHTNAAMPEAITVSANAATKATQQEDNQNDNEYCSQ